PAEADGRQLGVHRREPDQRVAVEREEHVGVRLGDGVLEARRRPLGRVTDGPAARSLEELLDETEDGGLVVRDGGAEDHAAPGRWRSRKASVAALACRFASPRQLAWKAWGAPSRRSSSLGLPARSRAACIRSDSRYDTTASAVPWTSSTGAVACAAWWTGDASRTHASSANRSPRSSPIGSKPSGNGLARVAVHPGAAVDEDDRRRGAGCPPRPVVVVAQRDAVDRGVDDVLDELVEVGLTGNARHLARKAHAQGAITGGPGAGTSAARR